MDIAYRDTLSLIYVRFHVDDLPIVSVQSVMRSSLEAEFGQNLEQHVRILVAPLYPCGRRDRRLFALDNSW